MSKGTLCPVRALTGMPEASDLASKIFCAETPFPSNTSSRASPFCSASSTELASASWVSAPFCKRMSTKLSAICLFIVNPAREFTRGIKPRARMRKMHHVASHRAFSNGVNYETQPADFVIHIILMAKMDSDVRIRLPAKTPMEFLKSNL